jgi:hypothetical protein
MSVAVLTLLIAVVVTTIYLMVAMSIKDKPWYGAMALGVLLIPGSVLALFYAALVA